MKQKILSIILTMAIFSGAGIFTMSITKSATVSIAASSATPVTYDDLRGKYFEMVDIRPTPYIYGNGEKADYGEIHNMFGTIVSEGYSSSMSVSDREYYFQPRTSALYTINRTSGPLYFTNLTVPNMENIVVHAIRSGYYILPTSASITQAFDSGSWYIAKGSGTYNAPYVLLCL
ncbi:MAG: hypothetical protein LBL34_04680 [Clostridiales bacterium]|nr:hypothetical protein [Clostridiales bacterium]